jgi:hypothetical protein
MSAISTDRTPTETATPRTFEVKRSREEVFHSALESYIAHYQKCHAAPGEVASGRSTPRVFGFSLGSRTGVAAESRSALRAMSASSIPAGRSATSHVETLAAETSGLLRTLILERGSIVFRRTSGNADLIAHNNISQRLMPCEWRWLACACQRCQDGTPELSFRPALPTFFQKFQTTGIHKTSSVCIAVLHTRAAL